MAIKSYTCRDTEAPMLDGRNRRFANIARSRCASLTT